MTSQPKRMTDPQTQQVAHFNKYEQATDKRASVSCRSIFGRFTSTYRVGEQLVFVNIWKHQACKYEGPTPDDYSLVEKLQTFEIL